MAYVAVQGGQESIAAGNELLQYQRVKDRALLDVEVIQGALKPLLDQIMSEASFYAPQLAALAVKQAGGSMEEAVFLLRAHRSSLPRLYYSRILEPEEMFVCRRISAAFKDVPGGQLLGSNRDYSRRFLDFSLLEETEEDLEGKARAYEDQDLSPSKMDLAHMQKVVTYLQAQGLAKARPQNDSEPDDVTKESLSFPSSRSQRLQLLTRGNTGAVTALGYADLRAFGVAHPTVGELRVGDLDITVAGLNQEENPEEDYSIGAIEITEVESFFSMDEDSHDAESQQGIVIGYGACYGQNESKAIAMSILDVALEYPKAGSPLSDEEFVLLSIDSLESSGFISHLKLPHYVTFQSKLDSLRKMRKVKED